MNNSLFRVNNNDPSLINCYWEYVEVSIYAGINQYIFYGHSFYSSDCKFRGYRTCTTKLNPQTDL
ncbi:hypothetical protein DMN57_19505 [Escherichia coli]|nr:hypothetical protein [Escherichia coli]